MSKFMFLRALNSPFKPFKLKWYCGKVSIGTPYFLPRKWVKPTYDMAEKAARESIAEIERYNERNNHVKPREVPTVEQLTKEKLTYNFPVRRKLGFDFVGLGWKTKWTDVDYRFEWSPIWSFVFFKWQIAITFVAPEREHYWPCWLYYEYSTDKTKSKAERIAQCRKEFSQTWTSHKPGQEKETIDYYTKILKSKYL